MMNTILIIMAILAIIVASLDSTLSVCLRLGDVDIDEFKTGANDVFNTKLPKQNNCSYKFGYKVFTLLGTIRRPISCKSSYLLVYHKRTSRSIVSYKFMNTRPNSFELDKLGYLFKSSLGIKYVNTSPNCPIYPMK